MTVTVDVTVSRERSPSTRFVHAGRHFQDFGRKTRAGAPDARGAIQVEAYWLRGAAKLPE